MKAAIERRVLKEAAYMIASGATVRETARAFGVSKSTVHKDIQMRLKEVSASLAGEAAAVLQRNKAQRHVRGGEATRLRYESMRNCAHAQAERTD